MDLKADNPAEKRLLDCFNAEASESLKARVAAGKKTIKGALAYLCDYARKQYSKDCAGRAAVMDSDEIIGQMMHYFEEDSLDCEGKAACAKVATTPNLTRPATDPSKSAPPPAQKKKPDGPKQMSLFDDLFGPAATQEAPEESADVSAAKPVADVAPEAQDAQEGAEEAAQSAEIDAEVEGGLL